MSEEVAALERELIMPGYRKASSLSQEVGVGPSDNQPVASTSMSIDGPEEVPLSAASSSRYRSMPNSTTSPYPVTYRSPAFRSGRDQQPTATSATAAAFPDSIENVDSITMDPKDMPKTGGPEYAALNLPIRAYPVPYAPSLPPLPDYLVKNRMNVGGLARKKARDRALAQQNPQLANSTATSHDLYKLGISKANHHSVRTLLGAASPMPGKCRTGSKVLTTSDWSVALNEMQTQRALERIEQLKSDKLWSLRQVKKQRAPGTQKAHWDYVLDEMKWLAVDFRQETRWKMAAAYETSRAVEEWHNATSAAERAELCVKVRPPRYLTSPAGGASSDPKAQMEATAAGAASRNLSGGANLDDGERASSQSVVAIAGTPSTIAASLPSNPPAPRQKRYQSQLISARAPVFDLPPTSVIYTLEASALPETYRELASFEVIHELFQDLPLYQAPSEPSSDLRQNRRIDEASPHYSRITHTSHLLESKPLLVSTLTPSKKRKRDGDWKDLADIAGDDERDFLKEMFGSTQEIMNSMGKPKDGGNKRFNPAPPSNAEARSAAMDWSPEEDRQLFIFTRQYSFNWDLIAHIFNSATKRSKSDERLAWDCFDRWNKKFAPPTPSPSTAALPGSADLTASQPGASGAGVPSLPSVPGQAASPGQIPPNKRDRRVSGTAVAGSAGGLPTPVVVSAPRRPELSKANIRHVTMVEATKKTQKKREIQQKQSKFASVLDTC